MFPFLLPGLAGLAAGPQASQRQPNNVLLDALMRHMPPQGHVTQPGQTIDPMEQDRQQQIRREYGPGSLFPR
jgi:hypothetical protein